MATAAASRKKINRISIVDQVCAAVKQDIADGVWKAGDKLPSEQELSETFGVNRLSVRMALQKLITLGLIETRVGEGSFVKAFSMRPFLQEIMPFYEDEERYHDVQQLRCLLETECMRCAAEQASEEEKKELKAALMDYKEAAKEYSSGNLEDEAALERLVDADFAFHYKTVKMSRNKLYKDIYFMVQQLIRGHITKLVSTRMKNRRDAGLPPILKDHEDTHVQIYTAIVNNDTAIMERLAEEMLQIRPAKGMDTFD